MNLLQQTKLENSSTLTDADLDAASGGMWMQDYLTPATDGRGGAEAGAVLFAGGVGMAVGALGGGVGGAVAGGLLAGGGAYVGFELGLRSGMH